MLGFVCVSSFLHKDAFSMLPAAGNSPCSEKLYELLLATAVNLVVDSVHAKLKVGRGKQVWMSLEHQGASKNPVNNVNVCSFLAWLLKVLSQQCEA